MALTLVAALVAALAAPSAAAAAPVAAPSTPAAHRSVRPASDYPLPDLDEHRPSCHAGHPARRSRRRFHAASLPASSALPTHIAGPVEGSDRHVDLSPLTGKGMWWATWPSSRLSFDAEHVVHVAKEAGLHQIWLRTGGSDQGFYGASMLDELLPAAHDAGIAVVAWDYPKLRNPAADAARAERTIDGEFGGEHIDAFSPDIETPGEGTHDTPERVRAYLSRVRDDAGAMPIVATVMNPTPEQRAGYPYAAEAPYVDAFAPMVYWSCGEPGIAAADAISALEDMRPVLPIGQAYNMASEGGRRGLPSGAEIWRFIDVAQRHGALGASLFSAESASESEWSALGAYPWHEDD